MSIYKILSLIVVVAISGCTGASGPKFTQTVTPDDGEAALYIYREARFFQKLVYPKVVIDNEVEHNLRNGGYNLTLLSPGEHIVETRQAGGWTLNYPAIGLDLKPGSTTYLKLIIVGAGVDLSSYGGGLGGAVMGDAVLVKVPNERAIEEISKTALSN
ncbi:uncharacterized protein DUF2846 [Sinobacterium caligoides]|uniref:Uncharacterized protein DUF2846 n=1 Tax=Sinobacterium caligoides TaxID=933926 RepID=A0A3N2DN70_9GAMM|nr:DUF2846 domain-containing protein [Sinobacterium caligoides]ROS01099.1 uncharacterized protein DUF2846 [Sinobacterium caligoides]